MNIRLLRHMTATRPANPAARVSGRGAMLLAGNSEAQAVVRVVVVDDGQVHIAILPGSVAKNRHRFDRSVA